MTRRRLALLLLAIVALIGAALVVVLRSRPPGPPAAKPIGPAVAGARAAVVNALAPAAEAARVAAQQAGAEAVDQARRAVGAVAGMLRDSPHTAYRASFLRRVEAGDAAQAHRLLRVFTPADDDAEGLAASIQLDILDGELTRARQRAWQAARRLANARPRFIRLWYAAHAADPAFYSADVRTIHPGDGVTSIRALEWASSVLLRFYLGDETVGVLKPHQTYPYTIYRGELAAYRLCPLIHCGFSIPRNEEVRISQDDLIELMGLSGPEQLADIRRNHSELIWLRDETGETWLYGTYKEWVPGFVNFPIEEVDHWRDLLDSHVTERDLRRLPLEDALAELNGGDAEWLESFLRRADGVTTYDLARQLSNLHVFDLLINNWDRYSSSYPSSNCQWNHGHFVSIDNGASFHTDQEWPGHDVQLRLSRIRLFSRQTIEAIRWMEPEALYPILFPQSPYFDDERERFEGLLERRQFLLDHVDALIERYGEDAVLIFP